MSGKQPAHATTHDVSRDSTSCLCTRTRTSFSASVRHSEIQTISCAAKNQFLGNGHTGRQARLEITNSVATTGLVSLASNLTNWPRMLRLESAAQSETAEGHRLRVWLICTGRGRCPTTLTSTATSLGLAKFSTADGTGNLPELKRSTVA